MDSSVPPISYPNIVVSKIVDRQTAKPRQYLNYTIFFNNTGNGTADAVSITDVLPANVTFISASIPPTNISGQVLDWYFTGIAPGTYFITLMVQVDLGTPLSTILVNLATCDYLPNGIMTQGWANTTVSWTPMPYAIYGYVRDSFGSPLAGVTVTVLNTATNLSAIGTTNGLGQYSVDLYPTFYMNGDFIELTTSNPAGGYNFTFLNTSLPGKQVDITVPTPDTTAPTHSNESPPNGGTASNSTPVMSIDVTDLQSGVNVSTIRFYIQGFSVMYDLQTIGNGYKVSYWHEAGFASGTVVSCRIVARDYAGNLLDYVWQFTVP
jgi:uncharacterized repeat protein (TIGR01451 family)